MKKTEDLNIFKNFQKFSNIFKDEKIQQKKDENFIKPNYLTEININSNDASFCCSYCNKKYSSKYNLSRHINDSCKIKKNTCIEKENIFKLLLEKDKQKEIEINELKKQNKILTEKIDKLINLKEHHTFF